MTTIDQPVGIDTDKLMGFVFRAVDEVGATLNTALVVMGDRLGLYRALAGAGPLTPGRARRSAPAPPSGTCASGSTRRPPAPTSTTTRTAAATPCPPSTRSR